MRANFAKNTKEDYAGEREYLNYTLLSNAIDVLPEHYKKLITSVYIDNISVRSCEKEYHYSRNTIAKIIEQGIDLIATCFD